MPFQLAADSKNGENCNENDSDGDMVNGSASIVSTDDIISVVESLEEQRHAIFDNAKINIKKAQQHQAKGYNNRQAQGTPFAVGKKVLKHNLSKGKLKMIEIKICWTL